MVFSQYQLNDVKKTFGRFLLAGFIGANPIYYLAMIRLKHGLLRGFTHSQAATKKGNC
jgi:hypothetical protein